MKFTADKDFWKLRGLPEPEVEYKFHPTRKWRFDFAWPIFGNHGIALEIEGGTWMSGGGHGRGSGMLRDMRKYNEATRMGWRIYRFTPREMRTDIIEEKLSEKQKLKMIKDGMARETVSGFLRSVLL